MAATDQRSVLIVDDHADTREGYATFLRWAGYSPTEAASGEAALAAVGKAHPDIIVLDLRLQDMSGLSVVEELRAGSDTRRIPIIVLTGADVGEVHGRATPIDRLLQKPILPDQLLASIEDVLRALHRARQPRG